MQTTHECTYSKSMDQSYPRKCIICGKLENTEKAKAEKFLKPRSINPGQIFIIEDADLNETNVCVIFRTDEDNHRQIFVLGLGNAFNERIVSDKQVFTIEDIYTDFKISKDIYTIKFIDRYEYIS